MTKQDFIEKSEKIHNNKYNYSEVVYTNNKEKVIIICPIHGVFYQIPNSHLQGHGCRSCATEIVHKKQKGSLEIFIKKANLIHKNNKYNYSFSIYTNSKTKIKIFCNICKTMFEQTPADHLQGHGCYTCNGRKKLLKEDFIKLSKKIHGNNRYNYSKVIYENIYKKIILSCNICNTIFEQKPNDHINKKSGCPNCANKHRNENRKLNTNIFIERAKIIFGDRFNYDKTLYIDSKTLVKIYCNKCKKYFTQLPFNHLNGLGCKKCQQSKGELKIEKWLEENNIKYKSEKVFDNCKNKKPLPFDFYLPDFNMCIEFDGEQHYNYKYRLDKKGLSGLENVKKRDKIKNEYCKNNNIKLLRIPYWDFKNIENILENYLKQLGGLHELFRNV